MKRFYCLFALLLLGGLAQAAHAFAFKVLDPTQGTYEITGPGTFELTFTACPPGFDADGCFLAINDSHDTFTFLDFTFPNNPALNDQDANCVTDVQGSLFDEANPCGVTDGVYVLDFFGTPGITPFAKIAIEEIGIPPGDFPTVTATVGMTPEPRSLWMLAGATVLFGLFFGRRKGLLGARQH